MATPARFLQTIKASLTARSSPFLSISSGRVPCKSFCMNKFAFVLSFPRHALVALFQSVFLTHGAGRKVVSIISRISSLKLSRDQSCY